MCVGLLPLTQNYANNRGGGNVLDIAHAHTCNQIDYILHQFCQRGKVGKVQEAGHRAGWPHTSIIFFPDKSTQFRLLTVHRQGRAVNRQGRAVVVRVYLWRVWSANNANWSFRRWG